MASFSVCQYADALALVWSVCEAGSATTDADAPSRYTLFHSAAVPPFSLKRYILQLHRRAGYDDACLSIAITLAAKYFRLSGFPPSVLVAHRLFAAAYVVASKFHEERVYKNSAMADACGLSTAELNLLELTLLQALDFNVFLHTDHVFELMTALTKPTSVDVPAFPSGALQAAFGLTARSTVSQEKVMKTDNPAKPLAAPSTVVSSCSASVGVTIKASSVLRLQRCLKRALRRASSVVVTVF